MTTIPLADAGALRGAARRTASIRLALGALLVVLLGAAWLASSRLDVAENAFLAPGTSGIVVLDLSASTESSPSRQTVRFFRRLAASDAHAGLVLFSDVAYEALPLASTSEELRPFLRYFRRPPLPPVTAQSGRFQQPPPIVRRVTPWSRSFRSGTRISAGLATARRMVLDEPARVRDVLLVSDLNDSLFDVAALEQELRHYKGDGIRLRIVALRPTVENRGFFASRVGQAAFVERAAFADGLTGRTGRPVAASTPWAFIALISLLAIALAANELLCGRLEWGRA